jgi:hypothetical protein
VVYDNVHDRYLVSNCGDGHIVQIDQSGKQSFFNTDLSVAVGLHIVGDTLFVSSNGGLYSGIVGLLLETGEIVFHIEIPEKVFLNDITSDKSGFLYVTDNDANKIFKVHIESMTYTILVDEGLGYPNGILFDEQGERLLVLNCLLPGKPILSISLDGQSVSTVVETGINSIDGLTEDNFGNYYFSSWATDRVYRYDPLFTNPPEIIAGGFTDPADIFYNKSDHVLAIPCFNADTLILLPHNPVNTEDIEEEGNASMQVYPNPFSDVFYISSEQVLKENVTVCVYDLSGRKIKSRGGGGIELQNNQLRIDAGGLDPGLYIVRVHSTELEQCCKIMKQ